MKIAAIVTAYHLPQQLVRLLDRLSRVGEALFVHVDAKTEEPVYRAMIEGVSHLPNVYFLERHPCYWGDFGHVRATLKGIEEIARRNVAFDYVLLLTGQDYPIKPTAQIKDILSKSSGKSFMEHEALPRPFWRNGGLDRIESWHFRLFGHNFVFAANPRYKYRIFTRQRAVEIPFFSLKRRFPNGLTPFGGSGYWCLSRECIEYVQHFVQQNRGYVDFFKYVNIPDEFFFQTILMNSSLKDKVIGNTMTYMDWSKPHVPLGVSDFDKLLQSPCMFARKFDITKDVRILDMLDEVIEAPSDAG